MKRLLSVVGLVFLARIALGQNSYVDSLRSLLDSTRADTQQLSILTAISKGRSYYEGQERDQSIMRHMIEQLEDSPQQAVRAAVERSRCYLLIWEGRAHKRVANYRKAVELYEQAGRSAAQHNDLEALMHYELATGELYQTLGDTAMQLRRGYRVAELALRINDSATAVMALLSMASVDTSKQKAVNTLSIADRYHEHSTGTRLGSYLRGRAQLFMALGRYDDAVTDLLRADSLFAGEEDHFQALGFWLLGLAHQRAGRSLPATDAFRRCMDLAGQQGKNGWYSLCACDLGLEEIRAGNLRSAEVMFGDAAEHARSSKLLRYEITALGHLKDMLAEQDRYEEAWIVEKRWLQLRDSSNVLEASKDLLRLEFGVEQRADSLQNALEQQEASRLLTRERTQRNVLLGFGAFAIVFAVVDHRRRRRIKQEHARSEALLLNILPAEVADELKAKGHADAKHFDNVTILFTDFKGFTQLSEQVTPAELVAELNTCFKVFDGIMGKYRIEKIKTIGDAYMAAGGLPTPNTTHAVDVVNAALEIRDFIAEGKARKVAAGLPYFEIRIGIHTGPVVAGIVGVKKFAYDIWGDTVNTASRMESSGEVGQVNISEATYRLLVDGCSSSEVPPTNNKQPATTFTFTPRGKVQAKGKGEMEMYFVSRS